MRRKPAKEVPPALRLARRELDQWRQRQGGRKRLPREFWIKAAHLARVHGVNRTARTLGLKYASLRQHLETRAPDEAPTPPTGYRFVELPPGALTGGSVTCMIELEGGQGDTLRMHVQGTTMADLATFAARWRSGGA